MNDDAHSDNSQRILAEAMQAYMKKALDEIASGFMLKAEALRHRGLNEPIKLPLREPNGRDESQALPFEHPFEVECDLLEDTLDAEFVFYMQEPPDDPLDQELIAEAHAEHCRACRDALPLCAHCLELHFCTRVYVAAQPQEYDEDGYLLSIVLPRVRSLMLCRQCRHSAHNGALEVS